MALSPGAVLRPGPARLVSHRARLPSFSGILIQGLLTQGGVPGFGAEAHRGNCPSGHITAGTCDISAHGPSAATVASILSPTSCGPARESDGLSPPASFSLERNEGLAGGVGGDSRRRAAGLGRHLSRASCPRTLLFPSGRGVSPASCSQILVTSYPSTTCTRIPEGITRVFPVPGSPSAHRWSGAGPESSAVEAAADARTRAEFPLQKGRVPGLRAKVCGRKAGYDGRGVLQPLGAPCVGRALSSRVWLTSLTLSSEPRRGSWAPRWPPG